jgi:hypothetical protein
MMFKCWDTDDVLMGVAWIAVAPMTKALVPEKSISTNRELVDTVFALEGVDRVSKIREESTEMKVVGLSRNWDCRRRRRMLMRQEKWLSVAESGVKDTMDDDIFRSSYGVVNRESEHASSRVLVEGSALMEQHLGENAFDQ